MTYRLCSIVVTFIVAGCVGAVQAQGNPSAKISSFQPQPTRASSAVADIDRVQDGLIGPVRRIKTEVARLSNSAGKLVEEKRVVLESSAYDLKGKKTENAYYPVANARLTGREVYKYDEKGNISEMTLLNPDGSLVSKEAYKYEFDFAGNWTKMTTSVAVIESGKMSFEPSEITYRTIMYYLDENMAKMLQPAQPTLNGASAPPSNGAINVGVKAQPDGGPAPRKPAETASVVGAIPPAASIDRSKLTISPNAGPGNAIGIKRSVEGGGEPPVNSAPKPLLKPVSGGVLNGSAISLPTPAYPDVARKMRASGVVVVDVVIDENGKVISARAISGNSILREVAVQAAYRARFSPTKLSGLPMKVAGLIHYKFALSQ